MNLNSFLFSEIEAPLKLNQEQNTQSASHLDVVKRQIIHTPSISENPITVSGQPEIMDKALPFIAPNDNGIVVWCLFDVFFIETVLGLNICSINKHNVFPRIVKAN